MNGFSATAYSEPFAIAADASYYVQAIENGVGTGTEYAFTPVDGGVTGVSIHLGGGTIIQSNLGLAPIVPIALTEEGDDGISATAAPIPQEGSDSHLRSDPAPTATANDEYDTPIYEPNTAGDIPTDAPATQNSINSASAGSVLPTEVLVYSYSTGQWKDQLVSTAKHTVDQSTGYLNAPTTQTYSYNTDGSPSAYQGKTMEWQGKHLRKYGGTYFNYDASGLRRTKTDPNNIMTQYYYDGSTLTGLVEGIYSSANGGIFTPQKAMYFSYDAGGNVLSLSYASTPEYIASGTYWTVYYLRNGQGDIVGLIDSNGDKLVSYTYDTWGNPTGFTYNGSALYYAASAEAMGRMNPFRYRGYMWDSDTNLYYCQSRYYDPSIGRFISADALMSTGQGLLGYNMYTYCANNPVVRVDSSGTFWEEIKDWFKNLFGNGCAPAPEPDPTPEPTPIVVVIATPEPVSAFGEKVLAAAEKYDRTPYSELDCADYVQSVFEGDLGVKIGYSSASQWRYVNKHPNRWEVVTGQGYSDSLAGDVLFYWCEDQQEIVHVAIKAKNGNMWDSTNNPDINRVSKRSISSTLTHTHNGITKSLIPYGYARYIESQ